MKCAEGLVCGAKGGNFSFSGFVSASVCDDRQVHRNFLSRLVANSGKVVTRHHSSKNQISTFEANRISNALTHSSFRPAGNFIIAKAVNWHAHSCQAPLPLAIEDTSRVGVTGLGTRNDDRNKKKHIGDQII